MHLIPLSTITFNDTTGTPSDNVNDDLFVKWLLESERREGGGRSDTSGTGAIFEFVIKKIGLINRLNSMPM